MVFSKALFEVLKAKTIHQYAYVVRYYCLTLKVTTANAPTIRSMSAGS